MLQEHELIPYESSVLPQGPWLVFAPHPDDEIFGMGGALALAGNAAIRVEVVIMTDGGAAGDPDERRQESLRAGEVLGIRKYHFWDIPDREISKFPISHDTLHSMLDLLKPQTIFLPGIQEYHPDHRATTGNIWPILKKSDFTGIIWLYEISRHGEANRLIDITPVLEKKVQAIRCFQSQLSQAGYKDVVLALNRSRSYTLGRDATHAEAFWSCSTAEKQDRVTDQHIALQRYSLQFDVHDYPLVSVIVRTKNRLKLLTQAIESISRQTYRQVEVIMVNDAGSSLPVEDLRAIIPDMTLKYIEHKTNQGRAAAANSGIMEAEGDYICFLDDDDLFYPQALENLLFHADQGRIVHARARCLTYGPSGEPDPESEELLGKPVDQGRLILENHIPFNTVCIPRVILEKVGPLDQRLEIYEDWDLMIRLSKEWEMQFINALVSEYRIFGSATYTGKGGADKQNFFRKKVLAKHLNDVSAEDILGFVQSSVDKVVLEKERVINLLRDDANRKRLELDSKGSDIIKQSEIIQELESELDHMRTSLHSRNESLALLEEQLNAVFSSTSWKITKPLRILKKMFGFNR